MHERLASSQQPAVPGVIDTIAAGLSLALAHPLLMTIPMLLDLYYWLGWRVFPVSLTGELEDAVLDAGGAGSENAARMLRDLGDWDMASLATGGDVPILVPSLLWGASRDQLFALWDAPVWTPGPWWVVPFIGGGIAVLTAILFMAYAVPIADAVTGRFRGVVPTAVAVLLAALRFTGLIAVVLGIGVLFWMPAMFGTAIFLMLGVNIGPLVVSLAFFALLGAIVFLYFAVDAIVVLEVGPLRAMYYSFNVVRRNFWPTLGFIAAALLMLTGLPELWGVFIGSPPGLLFAVVAHAFFAVGLAMASIIFFNDRLRQWRPEVAVPTPGLPYRP